jgi:hypothetical protein
MKSMEFKHRGITYRGNLKQIAAMMDECEARELMLAAIRAEEDRNGANIRRCLELNPGLLQF